LPAAAPVAGRKGYPVVDERTLLQRAAVLDQDALAQVHGHFYGPISRYLSFRVDDPQAVEDLTSEVFTRFLMALKARKGPRENLSGWFYGTAANVLKEYYRRRSRRPEPLDESTASRGKGPDEQLADRQRNRELREALAGLTEEQQQVLALRYGYEMPIRDVAETLNKSEGSIKMLQVRAIAALARKLGGQEAGQ
jgi:RNA polymerase sigma-70 factor (ECF subfamily)